MKRSTAGLLLAGLGLTGVAAAGVGIARARRQLQGLAAARGFAGMLAEAASPAPRGRGRNGLRVHQVRSIDERVALVQDRIHESLKDPKFIMLARQMTKGCADRDDMCELRGIYDWMKKNIRYTGDIGPHKHGRKGPIEGIDLFPVAMRTVEMGAEDCDGHTIVALSAAIANGFQGKARITSPTRGSADDWAHIYGMVGVPKLRPRRLVALDTTLPGNRWFGREAPYGKKRDYDA